MSSFLYAFLYAFPTKYQFDTFQHGGWIATTVLAFALIALITIGAIH